MPASRNDPKLSGGGALDSLKSQKQLMPRRLLQRLVRRSFALYTAPNTRP
jgi:hypothetical protein